MINDNDYTPKCAGHFGALMLLLLLATEAVAGYWQLDEVSSAIQFISVKNTTISEQHKFTRLKGSIDPDGKVELRIDLHAVETNIPIRNERMRSLLFNENSEAVFTANLGADFEVRPESIHKISGTLQLNGVTQPLSLEVCVIMLSNRQAIINMSKPTNINAADYNLLPGIEALREIASLMSIEPVVSVTFSLLLKRQ